MKRFLIIAFIISFSFTSYSQDFKLRIDVKRLQEIKDTSFLPPVLSMQMLKQLPALDWREDEFYEVFPKNDSILALRNGFFDVYLWQDSGWHNLSASKYFGYNYGAFKWIDQNKIYSLGGYGLYHMHSQLLCFNLQDDSWEMVIIENMPFNYHGLIQGTVGDTIFQLFGIYVNEATSVFLEQEYNGYYSSLSEKKWHKLQIHWKDKPDLIQRLINTEFTNYSTMLGLYDGFYGIFIFDKIERKIYFFTSSILIQTEKSPFTYAFQKQIVFQTREAAKLIYFDIEEGIAEDYLVATVSFSPKSNLYIYLIPLGLIILILVFIYLYIYHYKKNNHLEDDSLLTIIKQLKASKSSTLSVNELDIILQIDQMNDDVRRVKRSKIIKDVNYFWKQQYGKDLLVRKRNEQDRRYFVYTINV